MANRPHKIDGREVETKRAVPRDVIIKNSKKLCLYARFFYIHFFLYIGHR